MINTINSFEGPTHFLSNFAESPITYEGINYPTVEHAFQAAKTQDVEIRKQIAEMKTPGQAKKAGGRNGIVGDVSKTDWEDRKINVMYELLKLKFEIPELRRQLLMTYNAHLVEGNWWGDTFWGVCKGVGLNHLGQLLEKVREDIRSESKG